jgi:hypothetical protein
MSKREQQAVEIQMVDGVVVITCRHCQTAYSFSRRHALSDGEVDLRPCQDDNCTEMLCPSCAQFACDACGLAHCAEHCIRIGEERYCPDCIRTAEGEWIEIASQEDAAFVSSAAAAGVSLRELNALTGGRVC